MDFLLSLIFDTVIFLALVDEGVVESLVGVFVSQTEPSLLEGISLDLLALEVIHPHGQKDHHVATVFEVRERQFDLTVVIDLQLLVSEALRVNGGAKVRVAS